MRRISGKAGTHINSACTLVEPWSQSSEESEFEKLTFWKLQKGFLLVRRVSGTFLNTLFSYFKILCFQFFKKIEQKGEFIACDTAKFETISQVVFHRGASRLRDFNIKRKVEKKQGFECHLCAGSGAGFWQIPFCVCSFKKVFSSWVTELQFCSNSVLPRVHLPITSYG